MADGTTMAAWAVALHEAAHATQSGPAAPELQWRQTVITLCRYGPMFGMLGAGALLLLMRMNIRVVLILFTALCAVLFLLNLGTMAVERNANARLRRFLDRHLDRQSAANERLTRYLGTVASRDLGDLLRSPRYFLFSALPGTGKLRPSGKADH
jgi:Zn-dependent membrane protease YugP